MESTPHPAARSLQLLQTTDGSFSDFSLGSSGPERGRVCSRSHSLWPQVLGLSPPCLPLPRLQPVGPPACYHPYPGEGSAPNQTGFAQSSRQEMDRHVGQGSSTVLIPSPHTRPQFPPGSFALRVEIGAEEACASHS